MIFFSVICRKVWSCICIYTLPNICCIVLRSIWPCWYVFGISSKFHYHTLLMFPYALIIVEFTSLICMLHCSLGAVGISFLQFTNMNSMRNLIIIGLTLFLGISVPQFFDQYWTSSRHGPVHTNALWVCFP